ncbi:hypothetical protein ASE40_02015 [Flavobacterium sp. Root935]|uniref:hypothetical protein n=1 Tax=Flavobacterium sp. Root935 TaxID=1736610 RepID=UPI000709EEF2|nr:hypothetical protein [Flavobacterium sp. Root935]KRD62590.1 hypothetical protein ASE40_02015 [Flavobacterium sp. Root935]
MKKHIKYLIALFLTFVVIAGDGTLYSQSKSAKYYESSFVVLRRELNLKSSRYISSDKLLLGIKRDSQLF